MVRWRPLIISRLPSFSDFFFHFPFWSSFSVMSPVTLLSVFFNSLFLPSFSSLGPFYFTLTSHHYIFLTAAAWISWIRTFLHSFIPPGLSYFTRFKIGLSLSLWFCIFGPSTTRYARRSISMDTHGSTHSQQISRHVRQHPWRSFQGWVDPSFIDRTPVIAILFVFF